MLSLLRDSLRNLPSHWLLLTDYHLLRVRRRIEAVLVTDRAILVFGDDRAATEAAAVDLADFHAGCDGLPILPVVLVKVSASSPNVHCRWPAPREPSCARGCCCRACWSRSSDFRRSASIPPAGRRRRIAPSPG